MSDCLSFLSLLLLLAGRKVVSLLLVRLWLDGRSLVGWLASWCRVDGGEYHGLVHDYVHLLK